MAVTYSGRVTSAQGTPLPNVQVQIRYTSPSTGRSTLTNTFTTLADGLWTLTIREDQIDPATVSVTYKRPGLNAISLTNIQRTGTQFTYPNPAIDRVLGGVLQLQFGFDSGKYLITSLTPNDKSILDFELRNLQSFIDYWNATGNFNISIVAAESQLSNTDNEPNKADGTPNPGFGSSLGRLALSQRRASTIQTYIQSALTTPVNATNLQQNVLVAGPTVASYLQSQNLSTFPAKDTPAYDAALAFFKPSQYIQILVTNSSPPCTGISFSSSLQGNNSVTLTNPRGGNSITIDALGLPDRFGFGAGINSNLASLAWTPTYYQNAAVTGSIVAWGFGIYLELQLNPVNFTLPAQSYPLSTSGSTANGNLRQLLIDNWNEVGAQIIAFNQQYADTTGVPRDQGPWSVRPPGSDGSRVEKFTPSQINYHINYCFTNVNKVTGPNGLVDPSADVLGYVITRGDYVASLTGIPPFAPFTIGYVQGWQGQSYWKYKIC